MSTPLRPSLLALAALIATPVLFSSNAIIGRAAVGEIGPWTLAFLRWAVALALIAPFAWGAVARHRRAIAGHARLFLALGTLSIGVCGGGFYAALHLTTATNGTILYTLSPLMIVLLERIFYRRPIAPREVAGMVVATVGAVAILTDGDLGRLAGLTLNLGDLLVIGCAAAFAGYSVLLRRGEVSVLPMLAVFSATALAGVAVLAPFAAVEVSLTGSFPSGATAWAAILGVAVVSSILSFLAYQAAVQAYGPTVSGLTLYFLPVSGLALAMIFLGERPSLGVLVGALLVILGIVVTTMPRGLLARLRRR